MSDPALAGAEVFCARPRDVVELRQHLIEFHARFGPLVRSLTEDAIPQGGAEVMCGWLSTDLKKSALYWVAPEMCRLLDSVAPSIPPVHPEPPVERGLVVFATPLAKAGGTEFGSEADSAAIYWDTAPDDGSLGIVVFLDREPVLRMWTEKMPERAIPARQEVGACRLIFSACQVWPLNETTVESDFIDRNIDRVNDDRAQGEQQYPPDDPSDPPLAPVEKTEFLSVRRYLAAFWTLSQQRLAAVEDEPLDRATARRAARAGLPTDPVRVVRLREYSVEPEHDHHAVEWSHRWVVGGHWRQQPYGPGHSLRRATWIAPHVKGPAGRPLLVRDTVKAWVR